MPIRVLSLEKSKKIPNLARENRSTPFHRRFISVHPNIMPTYDYVCEACSHEWELFQSMKDSPSKSCPKCKKRKARRRIGVGAGLIFKGTGFYETDYKKKAEPKKKESDKESSGSADSSKASDNGTSKSESKDSTPAKKKETTAAKAD